MRPRSAALAATALVLCGASGCITLGYRRLTDDFAGARDGFAYGIHSSGVLVGDDGPLLMDFGIQGSATTGTTAGWGDVDVSSADAYLGVQVPWLDQDIDIGGADRLVGTFGFGLSVLGMQVSQVAALSGDDRALGFYLSWGTYWRATGRSESLGGIGLEVRYVFGREMTILGRDVDPGGLTVDLLLMFPW